MAGIVGGGSAKGFGFSLAWMAQARRDPGEHPDGCTPFRRLLDGVRVGGDTVQDFFRPVVVAAVPRVWLDAAAPTNRLSPVDERAGLASKYAHLRDLLLFP